MIVAVDFDGTIVEHEFPEIGAPIPGAIETLKGFKKAGYQLILWTCRENMADRSYLTEAVEYCQKKGLTFEAINENIKGHKFEHLGPSRKVYADFYIDDKSRLPNWSRPLKKSRTLEPGEIEDVVAEFFGVRVDQVKVASQAARVSEIRQIMMYFIRENTMLSFTEIAARFDRGPGAAFNAYRVIKNQATIDRYFRDKIKELENLLFN